MFILGTVPGATSSAPFHWKVFQFAAVDLATLSGLPYSVDSGYSNLSAIRHCGFERSCYNIGRYGYIANRWLHRFDFRGVSYVTVIIQQGEKVYMFWIEGDKAALHDQ